MSLWTPPSENESGVRFRMPMIRGASAKSSSLSPAWIVCGADGGELTALRIKSASSPSPKGWPRRDSTALTSCFGVPAISTGVSAIEQVIVSLETIASAPPESMHCFKMVAAGAGMGSTARTSTLLFCESLSHVQASAPMRFSCLLQSSSESRQRLLTLT